MFPWLGQPACLRCWPSARRRQISAAGPAISLNCSKEQAPRGAYGEGKAGAILGKCAYLMRRPMVLRLRSSNSTASKANRAGMMMRTPRKSYPPTLKARVAVDAIHAGPAFFRSASCPFGHNTRLFGSAAICISDSWHRLCGISVACSALQQRSMSPALAAAFRRPPNSAPGLHHSKALSIGGASQQHK